MLVELAALSAPAKLVGEVPLMSVPLKSSSKPATARSNCQL